MTPSHAYTYDALNRITHSASPNESWSYDPVGNLIDHAGSHTLYDGENRAVEVLQGDSHTWLTYDAAGNLAGNSVRAPK